MADSLDAGLADAVRGQIKEDADGDITAPENIIQKVSQARTIYFKFRSEHLLRIQLYAMIEGLIAGNPPYSPSDLSKQNLSHISNFNTLEPRSIYERACLSYWNLLYESETIADFELHFDDPAVVEHADILSEEWTKLVKKWPSFYTLVNTLTSQIVKFGLSVAIWPDERDWRWRVIELSKFYVTDQAQTDMGQLTCFCVETSFTAQYLFEVYNKFKDVPKDKSPWNVEELGKLLLWRANSWVKTDYQFTDVMDLQRRIQNNDIGYDAVFSDSIRIVSLLYKEYDGKISHYMFERYFDHGDFLFFADRQYEAMEEALILFTASPGEFTIHSNRGLGHKIFSASQAIMMLDNSIVDMARWSSTPLLKSPAGLKDFEQIRVYPGVATNIGQAEFAQTNFGANIQQVIAASQYFSAKVSYNAVNSGDDPSTPDKDKTAVSPEQAKMQAYREFGLPKNYIAHFYSSFDQVIRNMVIKMLKAKKGWPGYDVAKEWKDNCMARGVPDIVFEFKDLGVYGMPKHMSVKASRVAGDGSTMARLMGLQELGPISGDFGPREAKEYKREYVKATMGPSYVKAFTQDSQNVDAEAGGASVAGLENFVMQNGGQPVFSAACDNRAHVATHMALGEHTLQALRTQQLDAVSADKVLSQLIPHMKQHIQTLEKSPFAVEFLKGVIKPWNQLQQEADLNRKNALSMLEAAARKKQEDAKQTQSAMSDEERKNMAAQGNEKRADYKVQEQVQRAKEASDTRAGIQRTTAERNADNKRLQIQLDHDAKVQGSPLKEEQNKLASESLPDIQSQIVGITGKTPAAADFE